MATLEGLGYVVDWFDRGSYRREDPVEVASLRAREDARALLIARDMPLLRNAEKGLDPIAFHMVNRLRRMGQRDPIKLRGVLDNFEYYSDCLGLERMAATQLDLGDVPLREPRAAEPEATGDQLDLTDEPAPADNVHQIDNHRDVA